VTTITFRVTPDPEGGFTASAIGHAIFTQADTLWELEENAHQAARLHIGRPVRVLLHPVSPEFVAEQMSLSDLCGSVVLPGEHPNPYAGAFEDFDRELAYDGSFW
jgi:predicted RNase H-like HicB family nuclease